MKVDFIRAGIPVKNASAQKNFVSNIQRQNVNLKSGSDVFVKSQPVFKGFLPEVRRDVIREGADGITSCLAIYANVYGYAAGHIMPTQQDFDNCMSRFFPLCCCASSSYAFPDGTVRYPNSDEFVEILQKLWNESKGEKGADESKYRTAKNAMMDENHRLRQIKRFVIDDMARAMDVYSRQTYDYPIKNLEDVKNLALTIYDDETVRTINKKVSAKTNKKLLKGKESSYVKELATDEHYILSDAKYPVTFEYAGQETAKVQLAVNDGEAIENHLIYGSVSGRKVDENGEPLGGALIGLFKYNDTEFTKENALMTVTSKEDGSFSFEQIPFGIWYAREIEQPTGFVLNETVYEVNIAENEQVVEIEIANEFVRGNITLTKVDADFPDNKLTGAIFEIYQDNNADGKPDDGDTLIGTLTESEAGIYEMKDLLYGHYLIKETKAPEGFLLDTGVYSVFIETDGMTYSVENKAGVGFINEAMKGNLKIVKTSSDGKVEGFSFRITGANGYDVTLKTDENGEIFIEGLRIGEYTVSEVADEVSAPYSRPADKKANVMTDSTTIVEMHNVVIDTPKTGDNSKLGLWLALLGASAAGIGVTVYAGVRKKKKEDAQ